MAEQQPAVQGRLYDEQRQMWASCCTVRSRAKGCNWKVCCYYLLAQLRKQLYCIYLYLSTSSSVTVPRKQLMLALFLPSVPRMCNLAIGCCDPKIRTHSVK